MSIMKTISIKVEPEIADAYQNSNSHPSRFSRTLKMRTQEEIL